MEGKLKWKDSQDGNENITLTTPNLKSKKCCPHCQIKGTVCLYVGSEMDRPLGRGTDFICVSSYLQNIQRDNRCQRNVATKVKKDVGLSGTMFCDTRKEPFSLSNTLTYQKEKVPFYLFICLFNLPTKMKSLCRSIKSLVIMGMSKL